MQAGTWPTDRQEAHIRPTWPGSTTQHRCSTDAAAAALTVCARVSRGEQRRLLARRHPHRVLRLAPLLHLCRCCRRLALLGCLAVIPRKLRGGAAVGHPAAAPGGLQKKIGKGMGQIGPPGGRAAHLACILPVYVLQHRQRKALECHAPEVRRAAMPHSQGKQLSVPPRPRRQSGQARQRCGTSQPATPQTLQEGNHQHNRPHRCQWLFHYRWLRSDRRTTPRCEHGVQASEPRWLAAATLAA
jgi:hypothetical protein